MKRRFIAFVLIMGLILGLFSNYGTVSVRADYDFSDTTFIGDSRVRAMTSGGTYEYGLLPESAVYAVWSELTTEKPSFDEAWMAGYQHRAKAVFWFGIQDVRTGDREDSGDFVRHIEDLITTFKEENETAQIYILSVLPCSSSASGYYDGIQQNIEKYNSDLSAFCSNNGYTFVNITDLYDSGLHQDDGVNFVREWYTDRFLPRIDSVLHSAPEPPSTEPPVTEPPVTEPPVTEPPVTEPPVTEPSVTEPPVVTEPSASSSEEATSTAAPVQSTPEASSSVPATTKESDSSKGSGSALKTILTVLGVLIAAALIALGIIAFRNHQAQQRRRSRKRRNRSGK